MAEAPKNLNTPGYWWAQADACVDARGIGHIPTPDSVLMSGLRYEIRALTIQLIELTELLRQEFLYRNM